MVSTLEAKLQFYAELQRKFTLRMPPEFDPFVSSQPPLILFRMPSCMMKYVDNNPFAMMEPRTTEEKYNVKILPKQGKGRKL